MTSFHHLARVPIGLVPLLGAFRCLGESASVPAAGVVPNAASATLALFRVTGALALVLGVFFAGLWLFRNWERFVVRQGRAPKLAVCEAKSLGQRHTLYVVGYEQQRMLVAASANGVTLLTALPPAEKETVVPAPEPAGSARSSFGALFLQVLARKT